MVFETKHGYKLGKKTEVKYWFYKEIPDNVEPIDEIPDGYEIVTGPNHYPFLKRKKEWFVHAVIKNMMARNTFVSNVEWK